MTITRAPRVMAMLALIPKTARPEQVARLEDWERERLCQRAGCGATCSLETYNELIVAVWERGSYRTDASKPISDRPVLVLKK